MNATDPVLLVCVVAIGGLMFAVLLRAWMDMRASRKTGERPVEVLNLWASRARLASVWGARGGLPSKLQFYQQDPTTHKSASTWSVTLWNPAE
ncbi:MAG: hypothetical protein FJ280_29575 [Planctomycetes bacterium]|nr:hypothetical protein [Planctomycetota bacterium]